MVHTVILKGTHIRVWDKFFFIFSSIKHFFDISMKTVNFITLKGFVLIMSTLVMGGCASDAPVPKIPAEELQREFSVENVELIFNGEKSGGVVDLAFPDGEMPEEAATHYDMLLQSSALVVQRVATPVQKEAYIKHDYPIIAVTLVGDINGMDLEGEATLPNGNSVQVKGHIEYPEGGEPKLSLQIDNRPSGASYIGHTYELRFDEESIHAEIGNCDENERIAFQGEELSLPEALRRFTSLHTQALVENSGYTAARFTFKADGSLSVSMQGSADGQWHEIEEPFSYDPVVESRIAFSRELSFDETLQEWRRMAYDLSGGNGFWYQLGFCPGRWRIYRLDSVKEDGMRLQYENDALWFAGFRPKDIFWGIQSDIYTLYHWLYAMTYDSKMKKQKLNFQMCYDCKRVD